MPSLLTNFFRQILVFIFGDFSWNPPAWFKLLAAPLQKIADYDHALYLRSKKNFYLLKLFILTILVGAFYAVNWYLHLPEPEYTNLHVMEIMPTSLEEGSLPGTLSVVFDASAAKIELVGKELPKNIVVTPAISGKWIWQSDRNLILEPAQDWQAGVTYDVKIQPELFAKNILLKDYSFKFTTPKISGSRTETKFYEDPIDPQLKQAVATFRFSHLVDKSSLEKHVAVYIKQKNDREFSKQLGFKVLFNEKGNEAYVRSASIKIPARDSEVKIIIKEGVQSLLGGNGTDAEYQAYVNVPGADNYFKITDVEQKIIANPVSHLAERFLVVSTSAPAKSADLLDGLAVTLVAPKKIEDHGYDYSECWDSPAEIPGDVIAAGKNVSLTDLSDVQNPLLHSFKFQADPNQCLLVKLKAGTPSVSGFALSQDKLYALEASAYNQEVEILHEGSLLAVTGSKKLSILGRNQKAVKFTIHRIFPDAINHLLTQTSSDGNFSLPEFENYNFGPENISEVFTQESIFSAAEPGLPQYTNLDFNQFVNSPKGFRGLFYLTAQGYDPELDSLQDGFDRRLILVTDLGIVVKTDQAQNRSVFLMSFSKQAGVGGATIKVLGKNGTAVFEGLTDENGRLNLPMLDELKYDKSPTAIVAQIGEDLSFIPWNRYDRRLNFSRFDIGGLYTNDLAKSLSAYIFNDRGIYRPGEKVEFGLIVKNQDWTPLAGLPLELTITNPAGRQVHTQKINFSKSGFEDYNYQVSEEATLGFYELNLTLIDDQKRTRTILGTSSFKVDEFLPDRLKVKAEFNTEEKAGWIKPTGLQTKVNLSNLFGTPAAGNKVKGSLGLYPGLPDFSAYPGFTFSDPLETKKSFNQELGEQQTDENGNVQFNLDLQKFEQGNFFLRFAAEGFEKEGGRSVGTTLGSIVSPLDFLVGWKPEADFNFIRLNAMATAQVLALNQDLKRVAADDLQLELVKTEYVSVLAKQPNGSLAYTAVKKQNQISKQGLNLDETGGKVTLDTKEPGEFEYIISNRDGLSLAKIRYFVRGEGNVSRELERNAELKIDLSKKDYNNLEEIEISIQSPYTGTGLITIERDQVYATKWFSTSVTSSIQKITVPENLEGNAYVNVVFLRGLDSEDIFMSPLSYGVVPFSVSRIKHTADIKLTASEKIQSGELVEISLESREPVEAVVFAVDEGIHQVARYKQPDPLSHFYQKKALEVRTEQIIDLLLPEFDISAKASAAGGDGDSLLGKFKNPFKRKGQPPVVFWSGIKTVSGIEKFTFSVPDYFNGNLKIYAVAVNDARIGIAKADTLVQNDLVLQPTAPLAVAPGDTFLVSTTIANTQKIAAEVEVALKLDERLLAVSGLSRKISLPAGGEELVEYELKAAEFLGSADLKFIAESQDSKAEYTLSLSVRPASSQMTLLDSGIKKAGTDSEMIKFDQEYYPQEFTRTVSVATSPLAWSLGLGRYLENYPYGCTEQIVSQAIASLTLAVDNDGKVKTQKFLTKAFNLLAARQNNDGSLSMWPRAEFSADAALPTIHAARLALEAKQAGYRVPELLVSELNSYLREVASGNDMRDEALFRRAYASYVLVRSGTLVGNYLSALKEDLKNAKAAQWSVSLTKLLMAAAYQLQMQEREAGEMLKDLPSDLKITGKEEAPYYFSDLAYRGFYLDILSRHFPAKAKTIPDQFWQDILARLRNAEYNTFSAGSMILAIQSTASTAVASEDVAVSFTLDGTAYQNAELNGALVKTAQIPGDAKNIRIIGNQADRLFYQVSTSGFQKNPVKESESHGLEVLKEYLDVSGNPLTEFKQGEDLYVHLAFRAAPGAAYSQMAIVDLLPAGLELAGGTPQLARGVMIGKTPSNWTPIFYEAREDRVLLYGDFGEELQHYIYKAKVASSGKFIAPGALVQDMYNLKSFAKSAVTEIIIKK